MARDNRLMREPEGAASGAEHESSQFLTFKLDQEAFAIDIGLIREVLAFTTVTQVPRMPDYMRGVINLRGHVVSVVDLRLKLGLSPIQKTVATCVIILDVVVDSVRTLLGALVDSVQEVVDLTAEQISPPPRIGTRIDTDFIRGIGSRDEQFLIILDIDRVLGAGEVVAVPAGTVADGPAAGDSR